MLNRNKIAVLFPLVFLLTTFFELPSSQNIIQAFGEVNADLVNKIENKTLTIPIATIQANQILPNPSPKCWLDSPQWWGIITAIVLGLAGIFRETIKGWVYKPEAEIRMKLGYPDCLKIPMTYSIGEKNEKDFIYYFRFFVKNAGNYRMEDVEAVVITVLKKEANGVYKPKESFLPLNLVWAYSHEETKSKIQPGLFKHLDFGYIEKSKYANLEYFGIVNKYKIVFKLALAQIPNHGSHILEPGDYRIIVKFAANNLSPVTKEFNFFIADEWDDNSDEMFEKKISITGLN